MGQSVAVTSPFIKGLNTELSPLQDSSDFTSDELNMVILPNQSRTRRLGIDYEELYKFNNETLNITSPKLAFNCVEWTDINSPDEKKQYNTPYLVCQVGGMLIFFRNHGQPFSQDQATYTYDLKKHALDPSKDDYATTRCNFSAAYGCIFVSSKAIKPFYLRTAQDEDETVLPPETPNKCRVSCSVLTAKRGRGCAAWSCTYYINGARIGEVSYKSPADPLKTYEFPTSSYMAQEFNKLPEKIRLGITAKPFYKDAIGVEWGIYDRENGRFIGGDWPEDWIDFTAPVGTGVELKGTKISLKLTANFPARKSAPFYDLWKEGYLKGAVEYSRAGGLTLKVRDTIGVQDYLAVDTEPEKLSYAHLYNLLNQGWTPKLIGEFYKADPNLNRFPGNNLAQQYLKSSKTEPFKPAALINMTFGNTPASKGHFVIDYFEQKRRSGATLRADMNAVAAAAGKTVDEIIDKDFPNWDDPDKQVPVIVPRKNFVTDSIAYAGRIFYLCGDVLLYSQMLHEHIEKANFCYPEADPTSEQISDVIETDGGSISVPSIGEGIKLATSGDFLFVFGDKGAVAITGTANNIFTAVAYQQAVINAVPSRAPQSFVETDAGTLYWGLTGIYLLAGGSEGLQIQNISQDTIQTFYGKISNTQQEYCKGVYNSAAQKVYWFYPGDEDKPRSLNKCLVFDLQTGAFTPQDIATPSNIPEEENINNVPEIVSGISLKLPFVSIKEYPLSADYIVKDDVLEVKALSYLKEGTTEVFSKEPFEQYFSDVDCTMPLGAFEDLLNTAPATTLHQVHYSFTRERTGIDQEMCERNWISNLGIEQPLYFFPSKAPEVFSGTYTAAESREFFTDVDGLVPPEFGGRFSYKTSKLTAENKADLSKFIGKQYNLHYTQAQTGSFEIVDDSGAKILVDDPLESERYSYKAALALCLDPQQGRVTFGEFRNNSFRDWAAGDVAGPGYTFPSYLISHPMNAGDFMRNKTMPRLLSYFKRTETGKDLTNQYIYGSSCEGSVLWDWRTDGTHTKWDSPQQLYRPNPRTLLSEGQISTISFIRGLGRSYQIKLESVGDKNFVVEALGFNLQGDNRI